MSTSSAWKYRPLSTGRKGTVNTCLGPIRTEIYTEGLKTLCNNTRNNLDRLKGQISKLDPCLEYGIEHWHPESRPSSAPPHWIEREKTNGRWEDTNVMFTSVDVIESLKDAPNDDLDSYIGTPAPVNKFCYLCSSMDEHERHLMLHRSKRKIKSAKPRIEYIAPKPKVKKKKDSEGIIIAERLYRVDVFTGDIPNAGTSANVFITIQGSLEMLPKTKLVKKRGSSNFCFVRASKETFHIKGPNLGNLQILTIEHDGEEKKHAWYLDKVEITDVKALKTWVFNCQNWISTFEKPHYSNSVDLKAQISTKSQIDYMVEVITGKKQLAGTDANIFLTVFGTEGVSKKIHLIDKTPGLKCFERGKVDHFKFKMFDLGDLKKIRIEQDGSGFAPGWNLDRVVIYPANKPKEKYYFVYRGWISKDVGNGRLWREIKGTKTIPKLVQHAAYSRGTKIKYEVTVKTGDVKFAGTDANVFIRFCGSAGLTDKLKLDNSKNNFERDMIDEFVLDAENVGPLTKVVIGHDNFGPGAGWFLDYVKVRRHIPREEVAESVKAAKKKLKEKHKKIKEDNLDDVDKKLSKLATRDKTIKSDKGYDDSENDNGTNNKRNRKLKHDERSMSGSMRLLARTLSHISEEGEEDEDESDDDNSEEFPRKHLQKHRRPTSDRKRQQVASKLSDVSDDEDDNYRKKIKDGRKTPPEKKKFRSRSASAILLEKEAEDDDEVQAGFKVRVPLYEIYVFPCHRWLAKDEEDGLTVRELEVGKKNTHYRE